MVVVGLKRSKIREIQPKADISKLGYVRWPRILADCDIPDEWKAIDLKLFALLVQKRNKKDPYGVTRMPVRDARKFLGATKLEIMDSMCRLMDHNITVTYPESDPQEIAVLFPNGMYLAEGRSTPYVTGVWGTEVCWKFMPEVVGMLDDNSHYGRVHLETVRKLESLAAVKLFLKFAEVKHSMTGGGGYWQRTKADSTAC